MSWIGPSAALVVKDFPALSEADMNPEVLARRGPEALFKKMPNFMAILTTRDAARTQTLFTKLIEKSGLKPDTETYGGLTLLQLRGAQIEPFELTYCIDDNVIFIGNDIAQLKAAIDLKQGKGIALVDTDAYRHTIGADNVTPNKLLSGYINFPAYLRMFPAKMVADMIKQDPYGQLKTVEGLGMTVSIVPGAQPGQLQDVLKIDGYEWGRNFNSNAAYKLLLNLPPVGGRAFQFIPQNSLGAIAVQSPATFWKAGDKIIAQALAQAKGPSWQDAKAELKKSTGLDIDSDIFGWMQGEFALGITPAANAGGPPQMFKMPVQAILAVQGDNANIVKIKETRLRYIVQQALKKEMPGLAWTPKTSGDINYQALTMPMIPVAPSMGQVGEVALVTTAPQAFDEAVSASTQADASLANDATWLRVKNQLPGPLNAFMFVDISRINAAFPGVDPTGLLGAFGAIGMGGSILPNGDHSAMYVEMNLPKVITATDNLISDVFGAARGKARQTSCLSNLKQLSLAMIMFASDHDDRLPSAETWTKDLMPYVANEKIFKCPDDKSDAKSSYAMNAALSGKKLGSLNFPAQTVILFETAHPGDSPAGNAADVDMTRHSGGSNFSYADGHAQWQREVPEFVKK
jgi:prepilin-type processing-associated H-X9-DG protein